MTESESRREKADISEPSLSDRLPPHSLEAESGVLGCILLDPAESLTICLEQFKAGAEVFYDLRHRRLYETLLAMAEESAPIDSATVALTLKKRGQLEEAGGIVYLASLPDATASAANIEFYVSAVRDKYVLRSLVRACTNVVARIYEHFGEVDELIDEVERDILRVSEGRTTAKGRTMKDLTFAALATAEEMYGNKGKLRGLSWGLPDLDKLTSGLKPAELVIVAGRPGTGKTSLAMQAAAHVAIEQKLPVGVFSLEMSADSLALRMLCSEARVNLTDISDGFMVEGDFAKIQAAGTRMARAQLHIDDESGLSILQLRARARRMAQQHDIKLVVVDYMQLLHTTNRRSENRTQEIADVSGGCKSMAKELNVPVLALSQLNREVEKRTSNKPKMADLREGGSLEQDADFVGLLYRDAQDDESQRAGICPVKLAVAKQRNGPRDREVDLLFHEHHTRFVSASKVKSEDVPKARRPHND